MTKEKEEPTLIRGVPWALWLSSGLVIALLLFSTVMLMVTMYSGLYCAKPINSSSEFQPLIRSRSTTNESPDTATDEEVQKKISELFKPPSPNSSDIVFPSDPEPTPEKETPIKDKSCTPEYPICNNVENYPHDKINDIVAKYKQQFAGVFGEDIVVPEGDSLVPRFDTSDDMPLCYSIEKLIHPREGFTKEDKKYQIVNTREYKQGVRVELCGDPGSTCRDLDGLLGMRTTECKQLYHYRTLLAIDPKTGEPYKESFKLPSCCKCVIKPLKPNSEGK